MPRLDDDLLDLEQFFEAIPGFCASKIVDNPRRSLRVLGLPKLAEALIEFWNCSLSSNRVSESVKVRRLVVCMRVIEAADLSIAIPHIFRLFLRVLSGVSRSIEIGHSLRPLRNGNADSPARCMIASIISNAEEHNDRWFTLAVDELGVSGDVLHNYLAHGDSVLLANIIHITRHILHGLLQPHPDLTQKSLLSILSSLSKFDILNTLPELQHDFCALWNEIVQQARVRSGEADIRSFIDILSEISRFYVALHDTYVVPGHVLTSTAGHDDLSHRPASYPLCMTQDHHPKSTTTRQPEKASCSTTGEASQATTTTTASAILSESSPGDALQVDTSQHTATSTFITQSITDTSISSVAEPITQSPSSNNSDQLSDEGITVSSTTMVFDSTVISSETGISILHANVMPSPLNPQVPTIYVPDITSGTATPSATTRRANDDEDLDPTILSELTHPPD